MKSINSLPVLFCLWLSISSSGAIADNQLKGHPSPYLALHANDPVDWRSWKSTVFDDARANNQLIFLSIGYFSCHWCHVMQRESYQDNEIATVLNENYISVKVDRELRPDLDEQMINFVQAVRGSAGWPLNVFLTPHGYPVTGFTYLPKKDFNRVLLQLNSEWQKNGQSIAESARAFFDSQAEEFGEGDLLEADAPVNQLLEAFQTQALRIGDHLLGGFGNTTKFPNFPQLDGLLEIIRLSGDTNPETRDFVQLTLRMMAASNLTDQVNGGFFRYTTDPDWQTPHFEKMLYDNAQLVSIYLKAHDLWPDKGYASIAFRTLDFIENGLGHANGGYISSLSAVDKDNIEGGDYFWSRERLKETLTSQQYQYLEKNWSLDQFDHEFLIPPVIGLGSLGDADSNRAILKRLKQRGYANMPADDKRLAAWNAMMLKALTRAAVLNSDYRKLAEKQYTLMQSVFFKSNQLIRFAGNASYAEASFEDYAQTAHAFLYLADSFNRKDARQIAKNLVEKAVELFLKHQRWSSEGSSLIPVDRGQWIIADSVFTSPMTLWLDTATRLDNLSDQTRSTVQSMSRRINKELLQVPYTYASHILLLNRLAEKPGKI
ncbi:MAG: hypothetical protein ACI8XC_003301 [Gammaproteobacteria bacterium]|jgi:uncharacterized protein YyaL (SSP411 family)